MKVSAVLVPEGALSAGAVLTLDPDEAHHLRVRRVRAGSRIELFDGAGGHGIGELTRCDRDAEVQVREVTIVEPRQQLLLAVGAGDGDRFVALAERCTELEVSRLMPLITERVGDVSSRVKPRGIERARRRAREACKQCGNPWATVVEEPMTLDALARHPASIDWLLADPAGARMPALASGGAVGWIVGPEGGLTDLEVAWCRDELHARAIALGGAILRFDTAAVCAAILTNDRRH